MTEEIKTEIEVLASSQDRYPVDFDKAWQWVGYASKQMAEKALAKFQEGQDFSIVGLKSSTGGRPAKDIRLTVEAFKHFCMMAGTEKGYEIRTYFIQCERALQRITEEKPEVLVARALIAADGIIKEQAKQIEELKPKAEIYDLLASAKNDIAIGDMAKLLGTGQKRLFAALRKDKILRADNLPYQSFLDHGYFRVIARPVSKRGFVDSYLQTLITAKGREYLARRYGASLEVEP